MIKIPNKIENRLYSPMEVARVLRVTRRTIYRWIGDSKIIPETKTKTGRILFSYKEIYKFLYPDSSNKKNLSEKRSPTERIDKRGDHPTIFPKYERFI